MTTNLKEYHWTEGGGQLLGLDPIESVFTTGRGWGKDYYAMMRAYGGVARPKRTKATLAYIVPHHDGGRRALYFSEAEGSEGMAPGWNEMFFGPDQTLDAVQAAIETILKLTD